MRKTRWYTLMKRRKLSIHVVRRSIKYGSRSPRHKSSLARERSRKNKNKIVVPTAPVPLRVFCNPRCNTDSYVVKASESQIPFSHPVLCCGTRPFETVFWVAKRLEVAQKVAKNLVPLQPGPRFATDPFDSDPPTRDSIVRQNSQQYRPQPWPSPGVPVRAPMNRFR